MVYLKLPLVYLYVGFNCSIITFIDLNDTAIKLLKFVECNAHHSCLGKRVVVKPLINIIAVQVYCPPTIKPTALRDSALKLRPTQSTCSPLA